jgi:hypothetical protein
MRIDLAYNLAVYILRKERNGFVSIDDWNLVAPRGQIDTYNDFYKSIPKGQVEHDGLAPFKTKYDFTLVLSPAGLITLPDDYVHLITGNTSVSGVDFPIIFPEEDELANAKNPYGLRAPSTTFPIGEELSTVIADEVRYQIQLYPASAQTGRLWYYREPLTPVYAFTLNGRTIVYDAANSQDFEIADIYQNHVIAECLKYFGVNLSDQEVFQYAMLKDKEEDSGN